MNGTRTTPEDNPDNPQTPDAADRQTAVYWRERYLETLGHSRQWESRAKSNARTVARLEDENRFLRRLVNKLAGAPAEPATTCPPNPTNRKEQQ